MEILHPTRTQAQLPHIHHIHSNLKDILLLGLILLGLQDHIHPLMQGTHTKAIHNMAGRADPLQKLPKPQCMWWKTKEGMTHPKLPASQLVGLLSVAVAFGT